MKNSLPIIVTVSLIIVVMFTGRAVGQQVVFNKVLPHDGNSFNFVNGLTQDVNGYMWFASRRGIYSYDGSKMTTFKNNSLNPNSLAGNFSESIFADTDGTIWIGSLGQGLDHFDQETGTFTHFQHDPDDPASLSNDTVTVILRDNDGMLWIGTHQGLDLFDPKTGKFIHFRHNNKDSTSLSFNQVRAIYEDRQGVLWIGTGSPYASDGGSENDGGLNKLNKSTGQFTHYLHDPNNGNSLISNKVTAIFEDNQGVFFIGTRGGLHKMNRQNGTFERLVYDPANPEKFSGPSINPQNESYEHIRFIHQDAVGSYWYGTVDNGLYYFNPAIGKMIRYSGNGDTSADFSDNGAWCAFTSRDGILWIGTAEGNLYYIDPSIKEIMHTSVSGSSVSSFYEEQNGDFWIGTKNEIIRNIKENGEIKRYGTDEYNINASNNLGYLIRGDKEGNIWVGTTESLNRFDKKTEKFIAYKHDPANENSISNNYAIDIYEDSKSNLWIGTAYGLNLMVRKTEHFTRFYPFPEGNNIVTKILEDKSGTLWIDNWNGEGISRFKPKSKNFKNYLKGTSMLILFQDTDGIIWAGGLEGLYRYDPNVDDFLPFNPLGSEAFISDALSMVEDFQKNLWLTTSNQIVRINPERTEISFFGQNYGVGQNSFNYLSGYIKSNGEIYFGDETGYFSFFPDEFVKNLKAPEIVFTGLQLSDKKIKPGDGGPLTENLNEQKEIQLRYDQNVFSIELAMVDYANPRLNHLTYYLENFDINWNYANSENRAYYFNIPPGKYTFRVKGVNSYGVWAEKSIDIIILPPWYFTWWAYIIYALLFIAAIFGLDRFQRQRLLGKEREKNRERERAHAKEIEKAYTELKTTQTQLIQAEKMASLGELTAGIAHEIQNPLNFVNNFSEVNKELLEELNEEIEKGNLEEVKLLAKDVIENEQKINYHGKRADSIVKGMLQHSRSSSGVKEPTDINALADEYLRLAYHGLRAKNKSFNAAMQTEFDESIGKINVIPQDLGRVILNLITNAFYAVSDKKKQKTEGYEPTVWVITKKEKNKILLSVKDNGNGIPQTVLEKIFQPFFTTKPTGEGTGLGLSMSYEIVTKAHSGELKVENNSDEGATFTIILPTD